MKNRQITGFLTILILVFLLMSGCTSTKSISPTSQPTTTSMETTPITVVPTTLALTLTSTTVVQTSPTALPTTQASYSTNDINKHFIDVAFGPDSSTIYKWNKQLVVVAVTGNYNDNDVKILNDFFKLFNSYSSYTKLPTEVKQSDKGDIVLNFLPEASIKNINSDNSWKISINHETDTINYIYKTAFYGYGGNIDMVYINSDLKGDARTHWILRSLLYELGFPGETGTYSDSIFYSDSDNATSLSKIDLKALELMYGTKISNGMTLSQVKELLLINTN